MGTTGTSVIFLGTILALVVFLVVSKVDQSERVGSHGLEADPERADAENLR